MVLLLLINCLMYFPLFVGVLCLFLFGYALLFVHSNFAIVLTRKRELITLLLLSFGGHLSVNVPWLFLTVPWVGLQCVIVILLIILTYFNITYFKKQSLIYRHPVFTITTTGIKGRTLESCIVYFCNLEDRHISQGQENILMLVV